MIVFISFRQGLIITAKKFILYRDLTGCNFELLSTGAGFCSRRGSFQSMRLPFELGTVGKAEIFIDPLLFFLFLVRRILI